MGARSQTAINLRETREAVLNLPSIEEVAAVDRIALTTGRDPVSARKASVGYRYEPDKFGRAGLTPVASDTVSAPRAGECPVQLEGHVVDVHPLRGDDPVAAGSVLAVEIAVSRVHVHTSIRLAGSAHRIDPDLWRPLIMSFQQFYGLGDQVRPSRLSSIDEEWYR
ncbi:flavin reductase [Oerskovia sp. M15]